MALDLNILRIRLHYTGAGYLGLLCCVGRVLALRYVARTFLHLGSGVSFICAYLNKVDHGSIVVDEVVAVWVVLLLTPLGFWWQLSSVIAFRFFDIVKLPPASVLDRGRQNGFTVMLDDIFAAVYAILVVNSMAWVAGFYGAASPIWILQ